MTAALSVRAHLNVEALEARQLLDTKWTALSGVPTADHTRTLTAPLIQIGVQAMRSSPALVSRFSSFVSTSPTSRGRTRRSRWALLLAPCLALLTLNLSASPASAQSADPATQFAAALKNVLIWYEDLGSLDGRLFGYLHVFGVQQVAGRPGWFSGERVSYQLNMAGQRTFFAWTTRYSNGVYYLVMDRGVTREILALTGVNAPQEVLTFRQIQGQGRINPVTNFIGRHSPHFPTSIRNTYSFLN